MVVPVNAPVKFTAFSAENHLGKTMIAGEAAFLSGRADVYCAPADKLGLHLHEELLWNDRLVVAFNVVLRDSAVVLDALLCQEVYGVGLLKQWIPDKRIYADSELEESATIRNFRIVQTEGSRQVTRDTKHYNLQMIIAVGFKVNSERAVQFRKWVNQIAKDLHHQRLGDG